MGLGRRPPDGDRQLGRRTEAEEPGDPLGIEDGAYCFLARGPQRRVVLGNLPGIDAGETWMMAEEVDG